MEAHNATMTDELPAVEKIDTSDVSATAYFENGAKLRYVDDHDGIYEEVFAPSDPDSVMERSFITQTADTVGNVLHNSLDVYDHYDQVGELSRNWEALAEWITHD